MRKNFQIAVYVLVMSSISGLQIAAEPGDFKNNPAIFTVTEQVINKDVGAYTLTAPPFGNTLKREGKGSFEPATFRTRTTASQDSQDKIVDEASTGIRFYDVYASGYLDGAEVQVYRIVNGEVQLVRRDRVAPDGTVIEYWIDGGDQKILPAEMTSAEFKWADWSRPGSHRWFTVFAVDKDGNQSEAATPIKLEQRVAEKGVKPKDTRKDFKTPRNASDDQAPPAPTNFKARYNDQGVVEMTWDAVEADDLAGYRIGYTDTEPSNHRGVYLQLEGEDGLEPILAGDMVILSKPMVEAGPEWLSNRVGGLDKTVRKLFPTGVPNGFYPDEIPGKTWRLVKHDADSPVTNAGEYYFEMTLRDGDTELVGKSGIPDISTTSQNYYPVPEDGAEYIMEVWIKADRDDAPPVIFTYDGDDRVGGFVGEHSLEVGTEWKKHEVRFIGRNTDKGHHAYLVLKTTGPATYSFDNFRVYRADTEYLDYLPYQYENLTNSGMSAFRTHGPIKTYRETYSMRQFLGSAGETEGVAKGNTLPQALKVCERAGIAPWLQIEYHMSPDEWLAFAEYMAASFDPATDSRETKPYAYLRHSQGRTEPWTEAFETIYFELSNETWNGMFRPWTFDAMTDAATGQNIARGEVYGKFHDYVVGILQTSPYWSDEMDEKFVHVLGGWATSLRRTKDGSISENGYTQEAMRGSKTGEYITIAAYNGGWDEGEGPPQTTPASYFNVLSQVNQTAIPRAEMLQALADDAEFTGNNIKIGTYEAGPGYALNGLNNARVSKEQAEEQEQVMKSKLAGTATLDSFLARTSHGFAIDNFFTFDEGDLWKSHAKKFRGGQPHASFLPLQVFNQHATGDMLKVETQSVPTVDTQAAKRRLAIDDAPLAAVYALQEGDRMAVYAVSRKYPGYPSAAGDGFTPFTINLPFSDAASVTLHRLTGEITDTNIESENVALESMSIDPANLQADGSFVIDEKTGADKRGLPPGEAFLYIFESIR
jgi:hypothetical protein